MTENMTREPNQIRWTERAKRQILKIDRHYAQTIYDKISELVAFPDIHADIKKLAGQSKQYRLRVGDYRIIFDWEDGSPKIIEIQEVKRRTSQTYKRH